MNPQEEAEVAPSLSPEISRELRKARWSVFWAVVSFILALVYAAGRLHLGSDTYVREDDGLDPVRALMARQAQLSIEKPIDPADFGRGAADGLGKAARFNRPEGVAVDDAGNVYVADTHNYTVRKISPEGMVSTLAGLAGQPGDIDGTGAAARFGLVGDLAVDMEGNVYVADRGNSKIRKISPAGVVSTVAATMPTSGKAVKKLASDKAKTNVRFDEMGGVAVDRVGNVYVVESSSNAIRKIDQSGRLTTFVIGQAKKNTYCERRTDGICWPKGLTMDAVGNAYTTDSSDAAILKISSTGGISVAAGGGQLGAEDGAAGEARFYGPEGIAIDKMGNLYVADSGNGNIRKISAAGIVTTLAGTAGESGYADGMGAAARFQLPKRLAVDGIGNVYVVDTCSNTIRKISPTGAVTTLAGKGGSSPDLTDL
jgi:sugar lactone lactonase YvrE